MPPFQSEAQRKWMHANKPAMAADWEKKQKSQAKAMREKKSATNQGGASIGG